jgi:hypothetical protein
MGADKYEKLRQKERLPPFVPLHISTIDSPAYRAMSHGAKALFTALKRRYSVKNHNNGRIYLSQRLAAEEIGSHHTQIARWFRELQHYGFIVMTAPGFLGIEGKGKAPRWRLTELGYMKDVPTRDFMHWDGKPFTDENKKTKSRAGKPARSVPESPHTNVPENRPPNGNTVPEIAHINKPAGVRENRRRTRIPLLSPDDIVPN